MPRGVYDRTNAKVVQSEKAKLRWVERRDEFVEAFKKRDMSNAGRPRKFVRYVKHCEICQSQFEIKKANKEGMKFCSKECYYVHRKQVCNTEEHKAKMSQFFSSIDRSYMSTDMYSKAKSKDDTPEYAKYKNKVHNLTEKAYAANIDSINHNRYPRTICGVEGGWQLDHIKPVRKCFDEGISPEEASSAENLRMLPWRENLMRNYVDKL